MAMYAKGMSQRDIEDNLREIYGAEIPQLSPSKNPKHRQPRRGGSEKRGSSIRISKKLD
jgi:hypothetical protein